MIHRGYTGFERAALRYDAYATQQQQTLERLMAMALPLVRSEACVLDAGCGTGYLQAHLRTRSVGWEVYGIDVSEAMCAVANTRVPMVACADLTRLPIADATMDMVFSASSLQWVDALDKAYAEAYRVLVSGGIMAIATYVEGTLQELHEAMAQVGWPAKRFSHEQSHMDALKAAGFTLLNGEHETSVLTYPSLRALLLTLKNIGANRYYPMAQPVMSLRQLRQMEQYYDQHFLSSQGVRASWRIAYLLAKKEKE